MATVSGSATGMVTSFLDKSDLYQGTSYNWSLLSWTTPYPGSIAFRSYRNSVVNSGTAYLSGTRMVDVSSPNGFEVINYHNFPYMYMFDLSLGVWTQTSNLPLSGSNQPIALGDGWMDIPTNKLHLFQQFYHHIYDVASNVWTAASVQPEYMSLFGSYSGKPLFLNAANPLKIYTYDPTTDTYSVLLTTTIASQGPIPIFLEDGLLHFLTYTSVYNPVTSVYDPAVAHETWTLGGVNVTGLATPPASTTWNIVPFPSPGGMLSLGSLLYSTSTRLPHAYSYDIALDVWTAQADMKFFMGDTAFGSGSASSPTSILGIGGDNYTYPPGVYDISNQMQYLAFPLTLDLHVVTGTFTSSTTPFGRAEAYNNWEIDESQNVAFSGSVLTVDPLHVSSGSGDGL